MTTTLLLQLPFARQLVPLAEQISQQLPTDWYGLAAVALIVLVPAGVTLWNRTKLGEVKTTADNIKDQVTNGHKTNMRDDITNLGTGVGDVHTMLKLVLSYVRDQPTKEQFDELDKKVDSLERKINGRP